MVRCVLSLPQPYRVEDFFEFHSRDPQGVAERVNVAAGQVQKGLLWDGKPACLTFNFEPQQVKVSLESAATAHVVQLVALARRMLGLDQPVREFEQACCAHPVLGRLVALHPGLHIPCVSAPFEALVWAVASQQVSMASAMALRRKLILAAGSRHACGLYCPPDAHRIATLSPEDLRAAGFSVAKAGTLLLLARNVLDGVLPLESWLGTMPLPVAEIRTRLCALRGIGPWTADYALLRGFGWMDGSLHGDVAVRRALRRLLGSAEDIPEAAARDWLRAFSPWRALVAAHLWASHRQAVNAP